MIEEKFMRELYERTGKQYNRQPNPEEFRSWMDVLSGNSYADVDSALRRWSSNTAIDFHTQRVAGARMPSPAEIKASIQSFDRSQQARFEPCGKCEDGWVRVGELKAGSKIDMRPVRRCECFFNWAKYHDVSGKPEIVKK